MASQAFLRWCKAAGVTWTGVHVAQTDAIEGLDGKKAGQGDQEAGAAKVVLSDEAEGLGVYASVPLNAGVDVIRVPRKAALLLADAQVQRSEAAVSSVHALAHQLAALVTSQEGLCIRNGSVTRVGDATNEDDKEKFEGEEGGGGTEAVGSALGDGGIAPWVECWPRGLQGHWGFTQRQRASLTWCEEFCSLAEQQEADAVKAFSAMTRAAQSDTRPPTAETAASAPRRGPSWEAFVWALSHVGARAASVDMSGEKQPAIIPFVDLLNHRAADSSNVALRYEPADAHDVGAHVDNGADSAQEGRREGEQGAEFVVRTTRAVAVGEQLTLCYGTKDNAELLAAYGFALCPNAHETAMLRVPLDADGEMGAQRIAMLPRAILSNGAGADKAGDEGVSARVVVSWRGGQPGVDKEEGDGGEEEGGEGGDLGEWVDVDVGEGGGVDRPLVSNELRLVLSVASARDVSGLFAAMAGMGASPLSRDAWSLLARCADEMLDRLLRELGRVEGCPEGGGDEGESCWPHARLALRARLQLLQAVSRHAKAQLAA